LESILSLRWRIFTKRLSTRHARHSRSASETGGGAAWVVAAVGRFG
jgi:hypothetical protein